MISDVSTENVTFEELKREIGKHNNAEARRSLLQYLNMLQDKSTSADGYSIQRLLTVLRDSLHGQYPLLQRVEAVNKSEPAPCKATETFNLPMDEYANFLIGRGGTHIKALCQKHSVKTSIHPRNRLLKMRNHLENSEKDSVMATITAEHHTNLQAAKLELIEMAKQVMTKRKTHEAKVCNITVQIIPVTPTSPFSL